MKKVFLFMLLFIFSQSIIAQVSVQDSTILYSSGELKFLTSVVEGGISGVQCEFFKNGKLKSLNYKFEDHCYSFWFYETGKPKGESVSLLNNTLVFRKYDEDGVLGYEEIYDNEGVKTKIVYLRDKE